MPIKDASGDVIGVAQVINKLGGEQCFTVNDEKVFFYPFKCPRDAWHNKSSVGMKNWFNFNGATWNRN